MDLLRIPVSKNILDYDPQLYTPQTPHSCRGRDQGTWIQYKPDLEHRQSYQGIQLYSLAGRLGHLGSHS